MDGVKVCPRDAWIVPGMCLSVSRKSRSEKNNPLVLVDYLKSYLSNQTIGTKRVLVTYCTDHELPAYMNEWDRNLLAQDNCPNVSNLGKKLRRAFS